MTTYRTAAVDRVEVFHREAGDLRVPTIVLLHGFPTPSTQYQGFIGRLVGSFHLVAADYPGFAYSEALPSPTTV
jgi:pimeloyl-ACP methyl ester carboxylesterase